MPYGELSYFDGFHFAHIADYHQHLKETRQVSLMLRHYR